MADQHASRVHAAWRARAAAAAICAGTQVFLLGSGAVLPLSLNGAWIAALAALPASACAVLLCRRTAKACTQGVPGGRIRRAALLLLALTMTANAAFALLSLIALAGQSVLPQARSVFSASAALCAAGFCALAGGTGAARLCFSLRHALPLLVFLLTLFSLPGNTPAGLFPLLGAGTGPLAAGALCMPACVTPLLMLLLPPEENPPGANAPGARFFLLRILSGVAAGVLFLFVRCVFGRYESIASLGTWGVRLLLSGRVRGGILPTLLVLVQLTALLLLAVNSLCTAVQAIARAYPALPRRLAPLPPFLVLCAMVFSAVILGADAALSASPLLVLPAAAVLLLSPHLREDSP